MPEDLIRYDALVLDALRGVVRAVLQRVLKGGIPGEHHFFITFDTKAPGVLLSRRLKDQYPHEMTIVLQHRFWDLAVTEDRFEVRLSFNDIPERLVIPFNAVSLFRDPAVNFMLGLRPPVGDDGEKDGLSSDMVLLPAPKLDVGNPSVSGQSLNSQERESVPAPQPENEEAIPEERRTAEVVSLDKFRKK
jgi:hypothetical protein